MAKFLARLSERTDKLRKLLNKNREWKWVTEQENYFETIKRMLSEEPGLAHYAKDKDNIVTTDAIKTGLGITLSKTNRWGIKTDSIRKQIPKRQRKKLFNWRTRLNSSGVGLEKFRFYLYRKKLFLYTDHQPLESLIKQN